MKHTIISIMAVICVLAVGVPRVEGTLITIEIEAVVDYVEDNGPGDGYLDGQINVGDIITGTYTYESATPDTATEDWLGKYEYSQAPYGMILEAGGLRFETNPQDVDFNIYISNDRISPSGDIYNIVSSNNLPLSNGTNVGRIYWQLDDRSGQALSDTNLPLTPPVLEDWQDGNALRIEGVPRETDFIIDAHVTSAVPEPTTVLLFALGGWFLRKRNRP